MERQRGKEDPQDAEDARTLHKAMRALDFVAKDTSEDHVIAVLAALYGRDDDAFTWRFYLKDLVAAIPPTLGKRLKSGGLQLYKDLSNTSAFDFRKGRYRFTKQTTDRHTLYDNAGTLTTLRATGKQPANLYNRWTTTHTGQTRPLHQRLQPTATTTAKDCVAGSLEGQKRRLQRSDPENGPMAIGGKKAPQRLVENGGVRIYESWVVGLEQARMIESETEGLSDAAHCFFVHAVRSSLQQAKQSDGWFPFYFKHIRRSLPCTEEEARTTSKVWEPLVERGLIEYEKHRSDQGKSREYRVNADWLTHFQEAAFSEDGDTTVDAYTGQRKPLRKAVTSLDDENDKRYRGSLLEGLKVLQDAVKRFDKQAVEDYLVDKKRRVLEARLQVEGETTVGFRRHVEAWFDLTPEQLVNSGWPEAATYTLDRWKRVYPGQKYQDGYLRYRKLEKGYLNDLCCYAAILRQKPRHVEGDVWEYDTAWRVQDISGRVSEVGGALQSCSREMKAAAFTSLEEEGKAWNYDIVGSQLKDVIDATEGVEAVDTEQLRSIYLATSKQANADAIGISRDAYKTLLYLTTFMGSWKPTLKSAVNSSYGRLPEAVQVCQKVAWEEDVDADEIYEAASKHFLPLRKAVRQLADWLLTDYWDEHKYNAGGYLMRNACEQPFRKKSYVKTDKEGNVKTDAEGNPRYKKHAIRSQVLAWYLQGREADKMHRLAVRCEEEGIEVMGNEHDGLITRQEIPQDVQDEVITQSDLEVKPFADYYARPDPASDEELRRLRDELNERLRDQHEGDEGERDIVSAFLSPTIHTPPWAV